MLQVLLEDSLNEKGSKLIDAFPAIENLLQQEDRSRRLDRKELFFWGYLTASHIGNTDPEAIFKVIQKYSRHKKQHKFDLKEERMILQRLVNNIEDPMLDFIYDIEEAFQTTETYKNLYIKRAHAHRASAAQINAERLDVPNIVKGKSGGFKDNDEQRQKMILSLNHFAAPDYRRKGHSRTGLLSVRSARSVSREKDENVAEKNNKSRQKTPKKIDQKGYLERAKAQKLISKALKSPKATQRTKNAQDIERKINNATKVSGKSATESCSKKNKNALEIGVKELDDEDCVANKATNDGLLSSNYEMNSSPKLKLLTNFPTPSLSEQGSPRRNSVQSCTSPLGSHRSIHGSRKVSRGLLDQIKESGQAQEGPAHVQTHRRQMDSVKTSSHRVKKTSSPLSTVKMDQTNRTPKKMMSSLSPSRGQQKI